MIGNRSPVVQLGIRTATPLAVLVGFYLFFAGHNAPGGGFAAGLVFGAVVTLRTIAGLQRPTHAIPLLSAGIFIVIAVAAAPLLWGDTVLDQAIGSVELPVLGKLKSGSALPFDLGVTAIVVALVLALLDGLGVGAITTPEHELPRESTETSP